MIISIWFLGSLVLFGQDDLYDHGLDQNKWQDIRDGIRYEGRENSPGREWTYENREEFEREQRKYEKSSGGSGGSGGSGSGKNKRIERSNYRKSPPNQSAPPSFTLPNFSGMGVFGYIIIGIFILGLIFLLYYLFINSQSKGKKIKPLVNTFEEVNPTEIPLTELQRLLKEALDKQDYRGAVRVYFIFIVRDLTQKNWISWEKEKTNFQYLREMANREEFEDFNTSVNYFEIIWYGKREIDKEKFELIQPKFTRFLNKLGVK